jgi:hypothetical protein
MKIFLTTAATALAMTFAAAPTVASAQVNVVLTPEQQTVYTAWPAPQRTAYDAWPVDVRNYYWTLTPERQTAWWALNDEQRTRIFAMNEADRMQAWTSIDAQMANRSQTAVAATTAARVQPREPGYVADQVAAAKTYPVCTATLTDSCVNPREAGKRYGNRPMADWPGRPASEMSAGAKQSMTGGMSKRKGRGRM